MAHVFAGSSPVGRPLHSFIVVNEGMIEFTSSNSAEPTESDAKVSYDPRLRGTIAPTVVEPKEVITREAARQAALLKQEEDEIEHSPGLEKELNALGVPDTMQKFMQIALRKPHLITVTYFSNTGRFQHHVNVHSRFPKQDIVKVLDHLKVKAEEVWLGKPDVTSGIRAEIARQKGGSPGRSGGRKRKKKKSRRR